MSHPSRNKKIEKIKKKEEYDKICEKALSVKRGNVTEKKRKTFSQMLSAVPSFSDNYVRNPKDWVSKSYNLERQLKDFIYFIYCIYPAPWFLGKLILKPREDWWKDLWDRMMVEWFFAIGQGKSFSKLSKDYMTKKESVIFLAGDDNLLPDANMWIAKCLARGIPLKFSLIISAKMCDRCRYVIMNPANKEKYNLLVTGLLDFISRYSKDEMLDKNTLESIIDYISEFYHSEEMLKEFKTFKGRTLNSVIQLSNQWHLTISKTHKDMLNKSWDGAPIEKFVYEDSNNNIWEIVQIVNTSGLLEEGKKMHHCVYSYSRNCSSGNSYIFSLRNSFEGRRATIEVNKKLEVVQMKGPCNASISSSDLNIIRRWASKNMFRIPRL